MKNNWRLLALSILYVDSPSLASDFDSQSIASYLMLLEAAESGLFNAISHPDLVKNSDPAQWNLERIINTVQSSLDRIAATGVAMELNTSGLNKAIKEMNPSRAILQEMQQRQIPVVVGADAHEPKRVAANFEEAFDLLKAVGYTHTTIFLNRERQDIEIELFQQALIHDEAQIFVGDEEKKKGRPLSVSEYQDILGQAADRALLHNTSVDDVAIRDTAGYEGNDGSSDRDLSLRSSDV